MESGKFTKINRPISKSYQFVNECRPLNAMSIPRWDNDSIETCSLYLFKEQNMHNNGRADGTVGVKNERGVSAKEK